MTMRGRSWQGFLLRRVQTCFLWIFSEYPQEAGLDPPKQKSQDHARPVVVWGGAAEPGPILSAGNACAQLEMNAPSEGKART